MIPSFRVLYSNVNKIAKPGEKYVNIQPLSTLPNSFYSDEHLKSFGNIHGFNHGNAGNHNLSKKLIKNAQRNYISTISPTLFDKFLSKDDMREFKGTFPGIVRDLTKSGSILEMPDVSEWFSEVLDYNVPRAMTDRCLSFMLGYKMLARPEYQTPDNIRRKQIMGWCLEMLESYILILDDMLDESYTRGGKPCWYKRPDVGLAAGNDSVLIESAIFAILKKNFYDQPYYFDVIHLFHDMTHKLYMGQCLDSLTARNISKYKLDQFTMDHYKSIAKHKCSYYSFYLPIALAMHLANIRDPEMYRQAENILIEMGHFYQVQNDYKDFFVNTTETVKNPSDIQQGKCTWLAVTALERCSREQRALMEECYGSNDLEKVARVKELYNQLSLLAVFKTYEEESYNQVRTHIQQLPRKLNHDLFIKILNIIYLRNN